MLPSQLQNQVFGELKSKLQPNLATFGHTNFILMSPILYLLLQRPPTGLTKTVQELSFRRKKITSISHTNTISVLVRENGLGNDFFMAKGSLIYRIHCKLQSILYTTVFTVSYTILYTVHCTVYTILYTVHCTVYTTVQTLDLRAPSLHLPSVLRQACWTIIRIVFDNFGLNCPGEV